MKIYPSKHRVYFKKQAPVDSIPLSYVYNEEQDREIKISVEPDFSKPEEESLVMPYQQFDTLDVMIFDKKKEPVKDVTPYLKQKQGSSGLYYIPQQVSEFIPKSFSYSMLLQREEEYKKSTEYPVSIGIEIQDSTLFQAVISQVFAACCNPKETQLYPSNFVINGNASTESSFIGALADHYDLIITTVADLGRKLDESHLMIQDVLEDFYFKNNINVWIIGEQFTPIYNTTETYSEEEEPNNNMILQIEGENSDYFSLAETILYSKNYGNLPTYYVTDEEGNKKTIRFSADTSWTEAADDTYESVEFFAEGCPLRIFSKKDLGFLILSHPVFFKNLNLAENEGAMAKLFFEVLAYVYFHGYFRIPYQTGFITDEPIDYMLHTGESYLLTHGRMPVDSILTKAGYNSQIGYRIAGVDVRIPDEEAGNYTVKYSGLNRFGHLIFSKQAGKTKDPEKGNNASIYTVNHTVLLYDQEDSGLRLIESGVSIRNIDDYNLGVMPVLSSKYRIRTLSEQIVPIETLGDYTVYYDRNSGLFKSFKDTEEQTFEQLMEDPVKAESIVKVATVSVAANMDISYKDIRTLGGGEASTVPNYEMIDTGNLYGRPYRYGCPMIIQLPSRFKSMEDEILDEVIKHVASADYPIILYKD